MKINKRDNGQRHKSKTCLSYILWKIDLIVLIKLNDFWVIQSRLFCVDPFLFLIIWVLYIIGCQNLQSWQSWWKSRRNLTSFTLCSLEQCCKKTKLWCDSLVVFTTLEEREGFKWAVKKETQITICCTLCC